MRSLLLLAAIAAAQAADVSAQSVPAAPGDRFENWLFTAPAAWVKREDVDGLTLTSPDGQAEMRLLPGEELSSIGLDTWLEGQLVLAGTRSAPGERRGSADDSQRRSLRVAA